MFLYLKNLKPLHWALIGGLAILVAALAFFYTRYTGSLVQQGSDNAQIGAYQEQAVHTELASQITDQTVATFVKEQTSAKEEQAQSRTEVIDEYLDKPPPAIVVKPFNPKLVVPAQTSTTAAAQPDAPVVTSDAALLRLANRMYTRYCQAGGTASDCRSSNAAP